MKSDSKISHYTESGLAFADGSELKADVIVFATGFVGDMRQLAGSIVGPEVENQIGDIWGLDPEGEIRGLYKDPGRKLIHELSCSFHRSLHSPSFYPPHRPRTKQHAQHLNLQKP